MALVNAMWNHAATMRQEFAKRKLRWPDLTSQDLTDMLVYLRNLPSSPKAATRVEITSGANGQALFESKGCAACHTGKNALGPRLKGKTLTDIAVAMWDHEPTMPAAPAPLELDEMREIVSYLWAGQFFEDAGSPSAGARVFTAKRCAACHNDATGGAPKLSGLKRHFHSRHDGLGAVASRPRHARPDEGQRHRMAALRRLGNGEPDCLSECPERR